MTMSTEQMRDAVELAVDGLVGGQLMDLARAVNDYTNGSYEALLYYPMEDLDIMVKQSSSVYDLLYEVKREWQDADGGPFDIERDYFRFPYPGDNNVESADIQHVEAEIAGYLDELIDDVIGLADGKSFRDSLPDAVKNALLENME